MAQRKITINLPDSVDARHNVLEMLLQLGLISQQKARAIEKEDGVRPSPKKSRWARAAEEMSKQGYLKGNGEDLLKDIREFRDDFEIPARMLSSPYFL